MSLCTPWRVINGHTVMASHYTPRIVDCNGKPVVAFGNLARRRGNKWAWIVALAIVGAVNAAEAELKEIEQERRRQ